MCLKQPLYKRSVIADIFEHFDFDQNGIIDVQEFKKELEGVSEAEFEYYLKKVGNEDLKAISKSKLGIPHFFQIC